MDDVSRDRMIRRLLALGTTTDERQLNAMAAAMEAEGVVHDRVMELLAMVAKFRSESITDADLERLRELLAD